MNGVEMAREQGGTKLPFSVSGNVGFIDAYGATGGGGGGSSRVTQSPCSKFNALPPSNALQEILAELSGRQHFRPNQGLDSPMAAPGSFPPLQTSFPSFSAGNLISNFNYPGAGAANWVRHLNETLPTPKDAPQHFSQHVALNGGSLVLDTARGELVNASKMTPKEILEAKALAASKSHSEAERRRRERINSHLATLRTLLPSTIKTDKASLLAEVIDQVKMLKRQVSEIYEYGSMPTDHDELYVEKDPASEEGIMLIRASLCCNDRPDLMTDLRDAIDNLRLRTLKAEISTLGGRIKNVFVMTLKDHRLDRDRDISVKRVQEALQLVMDGPGGGEFSPSSSNKRQKVAPPSTELPSSIS